MYHQHTIYFLVVVFRRLFDIFNHLFQGRITLKCHLVFMFPFMIKNPPATLACFIISGGILWLHLL